MITFTTICKPCKLQVESLIQLSNYSHEVAGQMLPQNRKTAADTVNELYAIGKLSLTNYAVYPLSKSK